MEHIYYEIYIFFKSVNSSPTLETLWTVAHQAPPSMGFSRQEYWSGLLFPSPGAILNYRSPTNIKQSSWKFPPNQDNIRY